MFPEWQAWNRKHFSRYFEVFLDVPMETLYARELKGLYRAFNDGKLTQVVGVDIPFPRPACPDLIIDNAPNLPDPSVLADRILSAMPPLSAS
jgi:adenylylsulfate kinase